MLFPCFYNAPVSFYGLLMQEEKTASIELLDHYSKQTYRNRCKILGANGVINLVIPVVKIHGSKMLMKDVRIDYDMPWNKNHWRSIFSAYSSAPFFEFIEDSYKPLYAKQFTFLYDLNLELMNKTLLLLDSGIELSQTVLYSHSPLLTDNREAMHPKREFKHAGFTFHPVRYQQVFSEKHGFKQDLSILDLLFNEGPNARLILKESISKKV